jgi:hypothetical protein
VLLLLLDSPVELELLSRELELSSPLELSAPLELSSAVELLSPVLELLLLLLLLISSAVDEETSPLSGVSGCESAVLELEEISVLLSPSAAVELSVPSVPESWSSERRPSFGRDWESDDGAGGCSGSGGGAGTRGGAGQDCGDCSVSSKDARAKLARPPEFHAWTTRL